MSCNNSLGFFPANFSLQNNHQEEQEHPQFLFRPCTLPRDFHGFICILEMNEEEEFSHDGSKMGEKTRRLNMEQLKMLEKNFELGK
ncbi:unnamed protein product [Brassica oleracea var. botrytis]|uniref:Uncharacterized protein n=3 Tax=Brassica TaxID=3705 RepID=A0A0D2ZUL1_BRAOL|nr:unnamed protein product [Brassica napus]CDY14732.1 BnaC05g19890D [Brassica napus]VDD43586.1 unnamed protein product [Brassica oleracea]